MEKINVRNIYIELLNKIKNVQGVDKDYVDGLIELVDNEITSLDSDINAITSVIPETASVSNQLATVDDLPAAQVNSDWNADSGVARILNKPTIPAAPVNADWNASSGLAQILNKPTIKQPKTKTQVFSVSSWSQPLGETYWVSSYDIGANFDTTNTFIVNLVPVSPALEPTAAQKEAYNLVFHAETITAGGSTGVKLYARSKPDTDFTVDILYYTAF